MVNEVQRVPSCINYTANRKITEHANPHINKCRHQCPATNIIGFNMLCEVTNLSHIKLGSHVKELKQHTQDF